MPQRKVGALLLLALLGLLLLAPVAASAWSVAISAAFLVEFLSGDRVPALSWLTRAPTVRALAIPGVAADLHEVGGLACHVPGRSAGAVAMAGERRPHPVCAGASLVLAHGLAEAGKDDPRLRRAAGLFARAGFAVAVPTIAGLTALRLRPADVETVVATVRAMPGPVSIVGVSVGAGPALLAAADGRVRDRVRAVLSLGGYASAAELARHYVAGDPRLTRLFAEANPDLMDESAQRALVSGRLDELSADLRRLLDDLSPERVVTALRGRLLIVHGREDPLVPYAQSLRLAEAARASSPRVAIVGLVGHVGVEVRGAAGGEPSEASKPVRGAAGGEPSEASKPVRDLALLWAITYDLIGG